MVLQHFFILLEYHAIKVSRPIQYNDSHRINSGLPFPMKLTIALPESSNGDIGQQQKEGY